MRKLCAGILPSLETGRRIKGKRAEKIERVNFKGDRVAYGAVGGAEKGSLFAPSLKMERVP